MSLEPLNPRRALHPDAMNGGWPPRGALPPGAEDILSPPPPGHDAAQANAFMVIHRLLRGRWALTVGLAAAGAALGAIVGYLAISPKFETRGMVSIKPVIPRVIYEDAELQNPMQYLTSFVNKQATLIKSARVLAKAAESEEWKALGRGSGARAEDLLRRRVKVDTAPTSHELIFVTCTDEDARFTSTAVRQVLVAYALLYGDEGSIDAGIIREVEDQRDALQFQIDDVKRRIRDEADRAQFGTEDLSQVHSMMQLRVMELDAKVYDLELQLREAGALDGPPPAAHPAPIPDDQPLPARVIATLDPDMRRQMMLETDLEAKIARLKAEGFGEGHASVKSARAELAGVRVAIESLAGKFNEARRDGLAGGIPGAPVIRSIEELRNRYEIMKADLVTKKADLAKLDDFRANLATLKSQLETKEDDLKHIVARHRVLTVESSGPEKSRGRIEITSYGETPGLPTVDKRKITAAMGFMAGGGLPVGIMLLLGLLDRRFRFSDEAGGIEAAPTLLGILPTLPGNLEDPSQRAIAAHCVHQVRLLLQIGAAATGGKVYAITSPTPGDGKTSLALSLGLSFSAAGSRTLLIDFDMIGRGLTANLRLDNGHGLAEALRAGQVNGSLLSVASDRLWVIPTREEDDHFVSRLSAGLVKRLIDQVRDAYDIVLIDTGPVLGSLEAALVCAEADGVIMVVGRGQRRDRVENAFARVRAVGGRLVGMVFNRATPGDFRSSVSNTSMRSIPRALPAPEPGHRPGADRLGGAGPIVRTVALELDAQAAERPAEPPPSELP